MPEPIRQQEAIFTHARCGILATVRNYGYMLPNPNESKKEAPIRTINLLAMALLDCGGTREDQEDS